MSIDIYLYQWPTYSSRHLVKFILKYFFTKRWLWTSFTLDLLKMLVNEAWDQKATGTLRLVRSKELNRQ
jgi:hypothetical protein